MTLDNFKQIWTAFSKQQKQELVERLACNKEYLSTIAHGHRTPSRRFEKSMIREIEAMQSTLNQQG